MNLSELQRDALAEMANISASRAAKQLSLLLSDSIEINVPNVRLMSVPMLREQMASSDDGLVTCVYQDLDGLLRGRVHLVFHDEGSKELVHALVGDVAVVSEVALRAYEHEAMTEVGNIIISTFAAMLADLLGEEIRLALPHYAEGTADELLFSLPAEESGEDTVIIVVETVLKASQRNVSGALLVVLKVHSARELLERLDRMIASFIGGLA